MAEPELEPERRQTKSVQFTSSELEALSRLRQRTGRRSFSDVVCLAVHHGLKAIEQLEAEGRLVA